MFKGKNHCSIVFWIMWAAGEKVKLQQTCSWEHLWSEPHQPVQSWANFWKVSLTVITLMSHLLIFTCEYLFGFVLYQSRGGGGNGHLTCAWNTYPAVTVVPFLESVLVWATTVCQTTWASSDFSYLHTKPRVLIYFGFLIVQCLWADKESVSPANGTSDWELWKTPFSGSVVLSVDWGAAPSMADQWQKCQILVFRTWYQFW